jgi:mono/diheme cytochrome c family protein
MIRLRGAAATAERVRSRFWGAGAGLAVCAAVLLMAATAAGQEKKSVKAGVYTAAQADRGQALFRSKCASCHAPNRFTDDLFYTSFAGKPLWEMFDVISDTMPEDDPGSMKKEEYADVIAYLLKLNQFPAGSTDLPIDKDALSAIMMEKP